MDKHNLHILKTETKKSNTNLKQEREMNSSYTELRRVSSSCFTIGTSLQIVNNNNWARGLNKLRFYNGNPGTYDSLFQN